MRTKRRGKAAAKVGTAVLSRTLTFMVITFAVYCVSSVAGHIKIDQARHDLSVSKARLGLAVKETALLERSLRDHQLDDRLQRWATAHGYVRNEVVPPTSLPTGRLLVAANLP